MSTDAREPRPVDHAALDRDLREVCRRHGLQPDSHDEHVYGWLAVIGITGYDEQDMEYRRFVCLASPGLTGVDVLQLIGAKVKMYLSRRTPRQRTRAH